MTASGRKRTLASSPGSFSAECPLSVRSGHPVQSAALPSDRGFEWWSGGNASNGQARAAIVVYGPERDSIFIRYEFHANVGLSARRGGDTNDLEVAQRMRGFGESRVPAKKVEKDLALAVLGSAEVLGARTRDLATLGEQRSEHSAECLDANGLTKCSVRRNSRSARLNEDRCTVRVSAADEEQCNQPKPVSHSSPHHSIREPADPANGCFGSKADVSSPAASRPVRRPLSARSGHWPGKLKQSTDQRHIRKHRVDV